MKKGIKLFGSLLIACVLTLVIAGNSFAWKCGTMEVALVNATSVQLINRTGAPCGTLTNGTMRLFQLDQNLNDQFLAILLTAMSLSKTVWVYSPTDLGDNSDIITTLAVDARN